MKWRIFKLKRVLTLFIKLLVNSIQIHIVEFYFNIIHFIAAMNLGRLSVLAKSDLEPTKKAYTRLFKNNLKIKFYICVLKNV